MAKALISGFLLLCVAGLMALRIHADRVRRRGEELQAEALKLTPDETTLAEVRAFVSRSERPAGYAGYDGPQCDDSDCVVSIGPDAFLRGWDYPFFRRLGFLGIRPADYGAIVEVRGGIVREVIASMFYSTGTNRITSASVILVEQFSDADVRNTAAMDNEHGIAMCSLFDPNQSGTAIRYSAIGIATKKHPRRISLDLSCVTSFGGCPDIRSLFHSEDSPGYREIIGQPDARCSPKAQWVYPES
jgi:hypothetical protein